MSEISRLSAMYLGCLDFTFLCFLSQSRFSSQISVESFTGFCAELREMVQYTGERYLNG